MKAKLLLAYVFEFLRDGFYVGIFLLLPFITKDIHLTLFQAGSLQTVVNLLMLVLAVPVVSFLIKFGEVKILLVSILLYALGFLGISFSQNYFSLLLVFGIMGISFALYATISNHIRLTWFEKHTRGKELGNLMAVGDVAKVIFSIITGFLAAFIGWRTTSLSIGILTGIVFFLCIFLISGKRKEVVIDASEAIQHLPYKDFFKKKRFLFALITGSLDEGINAPFYAFLPFLLLFKGVPITFVGIFAGLYYVGNVVSRLIFGRLVDKIGNAQILIFLEITMCVITFLIASVSSVFIVGALALTLGFITEGTDPATVSMMAEAIEDIAHPQKASGIRALANGISKSVFPLFLGFIAVKVSIIGGFYVLAVASLLPIIPAILYIREKSFLKTFK